MSTHTKNSLWAKETRKNYSTDVNEEYQQLHTYLQENNLTTLSAEDWYAKYSQPTEYDRFYGAITDPERDKKALGFTTNLSKEDFYKKYFGEALPNELKK